MGMKRTGLILIVLFLGLPTGAWAVTDSIAYSDSLKTALLSDIQQVIDKAEDADARKRCPRTYTEATDALEWLEDEIYEKPQAFARGDFQREIDQAMLKARRLLSRAVFIQQMRKERHDWEAAATLYDRLIENLARMSDVNMDPVLTGPQAGTALLDSIGTRNAETRARMDSLTFANRNLQSWVDTEKPALDSLVVNMQEEITTLRHRIWELELRAGVAEADRSAAEATITTVNAEVKRHQEREARLQAMADLFGAEEGEVLMAPSGEVRINLVGFKFASGSAWLNPQYFHLLDKVVQVIALYPGATVRVEGHTDASGARQANIDLSTERANRIADALEQRVTTPVSGMEPVGYGPDRPIATNETVEGKALNRRIEVLIKPAPETKAE
jgi:outer membrane protein OmpA-like peptidoglycan-associated protein